ncbi:hypothetical protein MASR2M44_28580 [Bacteroidota bacterium]
MNKTLKYILALFALTSFLISNGQSIVIRKSCRSINDNTILWSRNPNSCTIIGNLSLYGRESSVSPFNEISSIINPNNFTFTHTGANLPTNKNWEYYFKWNEDCGSGIIESFSDTVALDEIQPDISIIDSVSVDPFTNKVHIGWKGNRSIDFASYSLYNYNRPDPRVAENLKDTFYVDGGSGNPSLTKLRYEITSLDSCGNRNPLSGNIHQTIQLLIQTDTCKKEINLNWSHYEGWPSIDKYYILSIVGTQIFILDSVSGSSTSYSLKNTKRTEALKLFVRAINSTIPASSSSNSVNSIPYFRFPPGRDYIASVSRETGGVKILITRQAEATTIKTSLKKEVNKISTYISIPTNSTEYLDINTDDKSIYSYTIINNGACSSDIDSSNTSNTITLDIQTNIQHLLTWNTYSTWNNGVEKYIINRGSGTNENEARNFMVWKSEIDTTTTDEIEETKTVCYRITATERNSPYTSESNIVCYTVKGNIFWPNAISIYGINRVFKPIGIGIEEENSSIEIFDRWGRNVFSTNNGVTWNGEDSNGKKVIPDVYFYKAIIKHGNAKEEYNGSIQVIN